MFLVVVDALSKWVEVRPMAPTTTDALIKVLRSLFSTHGLPDVVVSNNGPQLTSTQFALFLTQLGIQHKLVAPFHPAGNGLADCTVCSVEETLNRMSPGNSNELVIRYLLVQHTTPCP